MKEEEEQIEIIIELMGTKHSIKCSNCRVIKSKYNCSEEDASRLFYVDGWRVKKHSYCYCPYCANANGV